MCGGYPLIQLYSGLCICCQLHSIILCENQPMIGGQTHFIFEQIILLAIFHVVSLTGKNCTA